MKDSLRRNRIRTFALVTLAVVAAAFTAQVAWSRGFFARSQDPAKVARLVENPGKAEVLRRAERIRAAAHARAANQRKPDAVAARPLPTPDPPPVTGIVEVNAPLPASRFLFEDRGFQIVRSEGLITAYTGTIASDRRQGAVVVKIATLHKPSPVPNFSELSDAATRISIFPTPIKEGSLEIVSSQDLRLALRAESGKTFVFDIGAGRYVSE